MECANTYYLNKHLDEQDKIECACDELFKIIEPEIREIENIIISLKNISKDFKGYDFTEEVREIMNDLIGENI